MADLEVSIFVLGSTIDLSKALEQNSNRNVYLEELLQKKKKKFRSIMEPISTDVNKSCGISKLFYLYLSHLTEYLCALQKVTIIHGPRFS